MTFSVVAVAARPTLHQVINKFLANQEDSSGSSRLRCVYNNSPFASKRKSSYVPPILPLLGGLARFARKATPPFPLLTSQETLSSTTNLEVTAPFVSFEGEQDDLFARKWAISTTAGAVEEGSAVSHQRSMAG